MRYAWLMFALLTSLAAPAVQAGPVYFLVAGRPGEEVHGDSYVLPLEDPLHIAHARELISLGPAAGETIAVARIAEGADGINRDYRAVGQPPWNWHVTEFVGFWSYTVVEELSHVPEPATLAIAAISAPAAVGIVWRKRRRARDFR